MKTVLLAMGLTLAAVGCGGDECDAHCSAMCARAVTCGYFLAPGERDQCEAGCAEGQDVARAVGGTPFCDAKAMRAMTCDQWEQWIATLR